MKILYLHPPRNIDTPGYFTIPVGVFGIVNLLRSNGFDVIGFNLSIEFLKFGYCPTPEIILSTSPDVVLIDLHWYEHSSGAIEVANGIKRASPTTIVVLGGITATIFANEILEETNDVDFVICGEGEQPTLLLCKAIEAGDRTEFFRIPNLAFRTLSGGIVRTPVTFTKALGTDYDYVSHDWLVNWDAYLKSTPTGVCSVYTNFWLMIATGCVYNCAYCGGGRDALSKSFGRTGLWRRDADAIVQDISRLNDASVRIVNPSHDISMFGERYWQFILDKLSQFSPRIGIYLELFQLPSEMFLRKFASSVDLEISTVVFSPLVGNETLRRFNGKHYSNASLIDRLKSCHDFGLRAALSFSENLPGTNLETEAEQLSLIKEIRKVYPDVFVYSQQITLDPNSLMSIKPDQYGILPKFKLFQDYIHYSKSPPRYPLENGYSLVMRKVG